MIGRNHYGLVWLVVLLIWGSVAALAVQTGEVKVNPKLPVIPQRRFVLTDFGGVGDRKTMNTDAFRKAIAACKKAGGGEVVVPAGIFVTGPIELTDKMALLIEKGATIRGSENFKDYESIDSKGKRSAQPLIKGTNLSDVWIRGEGVIDGAGQIWWQRFREERAAGVPQQGERRAEGQPE